MQTVLADALAPESTLGSIFWWQEALGRAGTQSSRRAQECTALALNFYGFYGLL